MRCENIQCVVFILIKLSIFEVTLFVIDFFTSMLWLIPDRPDSFSNQITSTPINYLVLI